MSESLSSQPDSHAQLGSGNTDSGDKSTIVKKVVSQYGPGNSSDTPQQDRTISDLATKNLKESGHFVPWIPGYLLEKELGRGGMGIVYQALHFNLGRPVAIKMLSAAHLESTEVKDRFLREAEIVAKLNHPSIVQIFESGYYQGVPFLVFEYCSGGNLASYLKASMLPPRVAASFLLPLVLAVDHAHSRGVIHRDLKPSNILLLPRRPESNYIALTNEERHPLIQEYTSKITDLGLATELGLHGSLNREIKGTPSYMAPEQAVANGGPITKAVDIYSIGAVLYECLSGKPPYKEKSPIETLVKIRTTDPVPLRELVPKIPRDLETICMKCLERDPAKRYASAADVAKDLNHYLSKEPITARPLGYLERHARFLKRHQIFATIIATTLFYWFLFVAWYLIFVR